MKQILVIHGGICFESYESYISQLKSKKVTLERMRGDYWNLNLKRDLGDDYDVLLPKMPCSENARYSEWKIFFDKIVPLLDDDCILIGRSLGGIFLAKYLSENTINKKIEALFLVAAPYNNEADETLGDFKFEIDPKKILSQVNKIFIYQSKDDPIVPASEYETYINKLPSAIGKLFDDRGHFDQPSFPEILEDIKSL